MKLRALPSIFAALLLCSAFAVPLHARQGQTPPPEQAPPQTQTAPQDHAPNQEQPATNSPTKAAHENPPQNPPPGNQEAEHKASPGPKPPILKHRAHKAVAKTGTHKAHKKTLHNSAGEPNKVVVRNGGAKEGSAQLTPATSPAQARHQRASTATLLAVTDANLKRVAGRQLTRAQQSMLEEIQTYMRQAKAAAASADTNRAQTLAYKARLLSDELARK